MGNLKRKKPAYVISMASVRRERTRPIIREIKKAVKFNKLTDDIENDTKFISFHKR
jgi:hypothetical protein